MANLIAGKRVATELIQHDFTAENIVTEVERLLPDGPPRESMMEELRVIRTLLATGKSDSGGAIERVASITLDMIRAASTERLEQTVQS
jgi:lipid A disaccharide synthetase